MSFKCLCFLYQLEAGENIMKRFIATIYNVVLMKSGRSKAEMDLQEEWQGWDAWVNIDFRSTR
jgi:hypothetical protein